jgi:glutamine amidotransferase
MIAIIDYEAGNIASVKNALTQLGYASVVTKNKVEIKAAEKVILPGVGSADTALQSLRSSGLDEFIPQLTQPFLGICLGLQLLCNSSAEGQVKGLGIFDTDVVPFTQAAIVPHMGWNTITQLQGKLFQHIAETDVYFVHSYAAQVCKHTVAQTVYEETFSAALQNQNFYATQFHPEKSGGVGHQILKNFLAL